MVDTADILTQLIVRHVSAEDLPELEWNGEYTHFRRLYSEAYRRVLNGEAIMWMAELPEQGIVGQVFIHLRSDRTELADGKHRAYLYGFRVRPQFRDLGVGTRIMQVVEQDLEQRGFRSVILNVARDNSAALRLYQRLGYQIVGADPGRWSYIDHQGKRVDVVEPAWRMQKIL